MIRVRPVVIAIVATYLLTPAVHGAGLTTATYDFTATLDRSLGGSNQINGTFSIFENVPLAQGTWDQQGATNEPITLNFSNQTTSTNTTTGITTYIDDEAAAFGMPNTAEGVSINIKGAGLNLSGAPLGVSINLTSSYGGSFATSNGGDQLPLLTLADFPGSNIQFILNYNHNAIRFDYVSGTLTSLTFVGTSDGSSIPPAAPPPISIPPAAPPPISTPEPGTLAIFGLLALRAFRAHRESIKRTSHR